MEEVSHFDNDCFNFFFIFHNIDSQSDLSYFSNGRCATCRGGIGSTEHRLHMHDFPGYRISCWMGGEH